MRFKQRPHRSVRGTQSDLVFSTAGLYWADHSWRSFFQFQGGDYFAWRTSWGQRLLLDLRKPALLPEPASSDPLLAAVIECEKQGVFDLLLAFDGRMSEVRNWFQRKKEEGAEQEEMDPRIRFLTSAFHLAGVHRLVSIIPLLRDWEEIDYPYMSTGSSAMADDWWLEVQRLSPDPLSCPAFARAGTSWLCGLSLPRQQQTTFSDARANSRQARVEPARSEKIRLLNRC